MPAEGIIVPESTLPAISGVSDRQLSLLDLPSLPELEACIRCGLCLSVCPTYRPTQVETKSPRGRIALVKNLVEGGIDLTDRDLSRHMDLCLQCMACHSVCPTDVNAGEVVARTKSYLRATNDRGRIRRAARGILYTAIFPHYRRMELATLPTRLYNRSGLQRLARRTGLTGILPAPLRRMEELLPSRYARPLRPRLPRLTKARGDERAAVVFHLTCVNNVVLPEASAASVRVLAWNGCTVHAPEGVTCCGAPHETVGEMETARKLARRTIALYEQFGDSPVISDAAACGAVMKNYGHWLAGDPAWAARATAFSARVRDFHQYLAEIGLRPPTGEVRGVVTYDDPCHLCHAQGIRTQPRALLRSIPGLRYVELGDAEWCCGSAGTYNLSQPDMADRILADKMACIRESGATIVASANPGCLLQLEAGLRRFGIPGRVMQVSQLLDLSYRRGVTRGERS